MWARAASKWIDHVWNVSDSGRKDLRDCLEFEEIELLESIASTYKPKLGKNLGKQDVLAVVRNVLERAKQLWNAQKKRMGRTDVRCGRGWGERGGVGCQLFGESVSQLLSELELRVITGAWLASGTRACRWISSAS